MRLEYATQSDTGRVRENNEDCFGAFVPDEEAALRSRGALFVVADGMGGHRGGEIASRIAVRTIGQAHADSDGVEPVEMLVNAFGEANAAIYEEASSDPGLMGMGTTCTALLLRGGHGHLAHVGDSRAYVRRGGVLRQITQDHSLVGEMVRSGIITDEDARTHPKRNVITRSLGVQESIETDTPDSPFVVEAGDTFLLCSDGLTSYAQDDDIDEALEGNSPVETCRALVDLANARGGRDNITLVVVIVHEP